MMIKIEEITHRFGDTVALDDVSFEVAAGEVLGLLGPNGAGKTTMINVLSTLLVPDHGRASVAGHDVVAQAPAVREMIALTGQFAALDDVLTGRENLVLFGRLRSLSKRDATRQADELLERFSLADAADKRVGAYSGGMRRRLDIAASLVVAAPVLFLDEPTTGLDPRSRAELWQVVRELRDDGLTIMLTTQYLEEADQLSERIVVLDHGRVVAEGTPDELKQMAGGQACVIMPVDLGQLDECASALSSFGTPVIDRDIGSVTIPDAGPGVVSGIIARLEGIDLSDISLRRPTLEEVFLQVTDQPGGTHTSTESEIST
ncbi:ATP-binding cassette domain-containing protein [Candidatus Poriferisocius sp.]|uniref:ATP-binding cassette domain-containing protein n=1 Tax=Candidatus Poriferisocius sp. TaxID=3101276 RepID=UPI003B0182AD